MASHQTRRGRVTSAGSARQCHKGGWFGNWKRLHVASIQGSALSCTRASLIPFRRCSRHHRRFPSSHGHEPTSAASHPGSRARRTCSPSAKEFSEKQRRQGVICKRRRVSPCILSAQIGSEGRGWSEGLRCEFSELRIILYFGGSWM